MPIHPLRRYWGGVLIAFFFSLAPAPSLLGFNTDESATIVLGQSSMTGNAANEGSSNSLMNSEHGPQGLWVNSTRLYLADCLNNRILGINLPAGSNANAFFFNGQQGWSESAPNYPALGPKSLNRPYSVWSDDARVIVADTYNHRVLIYTSINSGAGPAATYVIGQPDMTSNSPNADEASPSNATLNFPSGVASDGTRLLIADSGNNRVLVFNTIPTSNFATANFVIGQSDMSQAGAAAARNGLSFPMAVATTSGSVVVADTNNNRVLLFNNWPTANNANADVVIGQADWTSHLANRGNAPGPNTLAGPQDARIFGARLFIADSQNNRVLIFNTVPLGTVASPDIVLGQSDLYSASANQGGATSNRTLSYPGGVFYSGSYVWVSDTNNNRTLAFPDSTQWTATATATATATTSSTPTPTSTMTATASSTITASPTATATFTLTPTPTATHRPSRTATAAATVTLTGTATPDLAPGAMLKRYYPNPVRRGAVLNLDLGWPKAGHVKIDLFDFLGRHVNNFLDTDVKAGAGQPTCVMANASGKTLATGVYWLVIQLDERHETAKVVVVP